MKCFRDPGYHPGSCSDFSQGMQNDNEYNIEWKVVQTFSENFFYILLKRITFVTIIVLYFIENL